MALHTAFLVHKHLGIRQDILSTLATILNSRRCCVLDNVALSRQERDWATPSITIIAIYRFVLILVLFEIIKAPTPSPSPTFELSAHLTRQRTSRVSQSKSTISPLQQLRNLSHAPCIRRRNSIGPCVEIRRHVSATVANFEALHPPPDDMPSVITTSSDSCCPRT